MKKKTTRWFPALFVTLMLALCVGCASDGNGSGNGPSSSGSPSSASSERYVEVTLSGGSGRASVESPAKVTTSADGAMTLTVVWSSAGYDKMVVDGSEYTPVSTSGNSTFEIPVSSVEGELAVKAETTAMSTPHMIDYTLVFGVEPGAAGEDDRSTGQVAGFHDTDLGNGWRPTGALELQYATCFTVDYFDGGYKLFCLSDGARYLTVPEGKEVPNGLAAGITPIRQPLGDVYLVASDTMCLFDALDALDRITVSGISRDNWYLPAAQQAMDSGAIVYGGKYSAPDYELLLGKGVRLAIESTMIDHTPSVREKLIELGIPVFTEMSSYESEPLGRMEWVKCYGAMLDLEDEAQRLFDEQIAQLEAISAADSGKTVAFFYINSNGAAVVRKPGDYITSMIDLAGGDYIFDELDEADDSMSSVTLEMERFYALGKDADIIIYNASIDGSVHDVTDLVRKNELLKDFRAVQDGNVWTTEQNMYQQMMQTGRIIADFHAVITGSGAQTTYVHRLD